MWFTSPRTNRLTILECRVAGRAYGLDKTLVVEREDLRRLLPFHTVLAVIERDQVGVWMPNPFEDLWCNP